MHIGVSLPHHAIGPDPVAIRDWTQAADDLGIDQLIVHKHIILPGPGAASRGGLPGMAAGLGKITRLVPNLAPLSLAPQARQDWLCAGLVVGVPHETPGSRSGMLQRHQIMYTRSDGRNTSHGA